MTTGRNEKCPCGSGKKYKKCCIDKDVALGAAKAVARVPPVQALIGERSVSGSYWPAARRVDPFESTFRNASFDEKLRLLRDKLLSTSDLTNFEIHEYLSPLAELAERCDRSSDFEALLRLTEAHHPNLFSSGPNYSDWRIHEAVRSGGDLRAPLLTFFRNLYDSEVAHEVYDRLRYHGRMTELADVLREAWPEVKRWSRRGGDKTPAIIRQWALDAIVDQHFAERPLLQANDERLLADLGVFRVDRAEPLGRLMLQADWCLDVDVEALARHFIERRQSRPPRAWSNSDFDGHDGKPVAHVGALLDELGDEFARDLHSQHDWPFSRSCMAVEELLLYLQANDPRKRKWSTWWLLPDPDTFAEVAFHGADDCLKGNHRQAAFVEAMPHWIDFLVSRGLANPQDTDGLWGSLRTDCASLPDELDRHMGHDPLMLGRLRAVLALPTSRARHSDVAPLSTRDATTTAP